MPPGRVPARHSRQHSLPKRFAASRRLRASEIAVHTWSLTAALERTSQVFVIGHALVVSVTHKSAHLHPPRAAAPPAASFSDGAVSAVNSTGHEQRACSRCTTVDDVSV